MDNPQKNTIIIVTSLIAVIIAALVMAGRLSNINSIEELVPQFMGLKFNTALGLALIGATLFLTQLPHLKYTKLAFVTLSLITAGLGVIVASQYLFHFNSGIDELFVKDVFADAGNNAYPGRMAVNTTCCIFSFGITFIFFATNNNFLHRAGQYILHIITSIATISMIGHLYGLSVLYRLNYINSMSVPTTTLFLCLSIAASLLHPQYGFATLFTGNKVGNLMARRLFLPLVFIIIIPGIFKIEGDDHFFSPELRIYLFTVLILSIIGITANWLNNIDEQRLNTNNEVLALNTSLEKRAEQRSLALLKTVAKLEASEKKYRLLIEHASDAIYVLDVQGNFMEVNASMCKMTGYTRDELLELRIERLIAPDELITDPIDYNAVSMDRSIIKERRFKKKDGLIFHMEVNMKKFAEDKVLVIARDITNRKVMEAELKEAELKFRTLADKSMVGVYIVQKGRYIYVNPRFAEIFGYSQREITDADSVDIIISDDFKAISLEHVRSRMMGEVDSVHYEVRGRCKDGSLNWVELYGNRVDIAGEPTIIGSAIDITKRKKAEEELRLSEQKYKLLFDSNPLPMWMIAKDDLSIIAVNAAAVRIYGYTVEEFLKMSIKDIRLVDDWDKLVVSYAEHEPALGHMGAFKHRKKDGTIINVQIIAEEIVFEGKQVRLSLANDITAKIKSEELLQKSEANLQTILNTTDTAYALFDKDLNALEFNQMAVRFVREQYNHNPQKGDKLKDYFPPERFPQFMQFTKMVLSGNDISYEVDYPQPNGIIYWYYVRLFPIIDNNKNILGLMMALYDITGRKNAENSLKIAYQRIHDQINSIKNMAWKQSHYIRSPLANLKGLAILLKEDPANEETLDYILVELDRLDAVIVEMERDAADQQDNSD
ncbi:PAS domain-containing protein [Mucilaginibacter sp. SP1R1]|uniref:PAS domain-containing protein n=1 Tax=Mucilaginibacter sp. SP1R1 TaxID=2723091 RepID=UPI00161F13E7|nr:PAS domain-containing protein [Mucilaginibacter sp. SP1R1]MBB6151431.1 PAS domain S-box-containing protein [Mucilaginibacter sp. SP1R1]